MEMILVTATSSMFVRLWIYRHQLKTLKNCTINEKASIYFVPLHHSEFCRGLGALSLLKVYSIEFLDFSGLALGGNIVSKEKM